MKNSTLALSAAIAAALASNASAQSITPLVLEGDVIPGVGNVTFIDNLAINDNGEWTVEVRTDNPNAAANSAIMKNGSVMLVEGQNMVTPGGSTLLGFDSMTLSTAGNSAFNLGLASVAPGQEGGVYWNDKLVIQTGDLIGTPNGFSAGSTYSEILEVRANNSNQILVLCDFSDPLLSISIDRALITLTLDAAGNLISEHLIVRTGDAYPNGMGLIITEIAIYAHFWGFNDAGQALYRATTDIGSSGSDNAVMLDMNILVEEGAASFIAGRNWSGMTTPEMGVNNAGDWIASLNIDGGSGDGQILVYNNTKFMQKADPVPGFPTFNIQSFGSGPVEVANNGNVVWYANWDDPVTSVDEGLFINNTIYVQEGVSMVGSATIKKLVGQIDGYHVSPGGNFLIFEAELDNGLSGAFRIDLSGVSTGGPGTAVCFGDGLGPGQCPCGNNGGSGEGCMNSSFSGGVLDATGSASVVLGGVAFQANTLPANRIALLVSGGTSTTGLFGDGMLCVGTTFTGHGAMMSSGSGTANWGTSVLTGSGFTAGQTVFFQVLFRDPFGPCGSSFGASAAYQIDFIQ